MTNPQAQANCERAEREGLIRAYFPNGSSFDGWLWQCCHCRHYIDDTNNPQPGKLSPPFTCCTWGVLDRIYEAQATNRYGYGSSFHPPEDVELRELDPVCRRFTRKDDDDPSREPPKPDCPGQMFLSEINTPVEVRVELLAAKGSEA